MFVGTILGPAFRPVIAEIGEAPLLRGGEEGIGLDVDLAGPLDTSVDGSDACLLV